MRALQCSPEFTQRQKIMHDYDMKKQEEETPVLVEDDADNEHLHDDHQDEYGHPVSLLHSHCSWRATI